jgi:TPR repeat protein
VLKEEDSSARAMIALGLLYAAGNPNEAIGTLVQEEKTSKYWFAKAEALESGEGQFLLGKAQIEGKLIPANPPEGFDRLEKAVAMGWTPALVPLGDCHYQGLATRRDHKKAHALFQLAEESGETEALSRLGLLFMKGHGVGQDQEHGARLFKQGAEAGDPSSMFYYAACLEDGAGVAQDWETSRAWFIKAARAGEGSAIEWCKKNEVPINQVELSNR